MWYRLLFDFHVNCVFLLASIIICTCSVYRYNRLQVIQQMRWEFGSVLPADIKYNLSEQEVLVTFIIY